MRLFGRSQAKESSRLIGAYATARKIADEYVTEKERTSEELLASVRFAEAKVEEMQHMGFSSGEMAAQGMLASYRAAYEAALRREETKEET